MYRGILQSLNSAGIRTPRIEGVFERFPQVGKGFILFGHGLEIPEATRVVYTSDVCEIEFQAPNQLEFVTQSKSIYTLDWKEVN